MKRKSKFKKWWERHWDEVLYVLFMTILLVGTYFAIKFPPAGI